MSPLVAGALSVWVGWRLGTKSLDKQNLIWFNHISFFFYTVSDHAQEAPMFLSGCFFGAPTTDGNNCEGGPNVNEMTNLWCSCCWGELESTPVFVNAQCLNTPTADGNNHDRVPIFWKHNALMLAPAAIDGRNQSCLEQVTTQKHEEYKNY